MKFSRSSPFTGETTSASLSPTQTNSGTRSGTTTRTSTISVTSSVYLFYITPSPVGFRAPPILLVSFLPVSGRWQSRTAGQGWYDHFGASQLIVVKGEGLSSHPKIGIFKEAILGSGVWLSRIQRLLLINFVNSLPGKLTTAWLSWVLNVQFSPCF